MPQRNETGLNFAVTIGRPVARPLPASAAA